MGVPLDAGSVQLEDEECVHKARGRPLGRYSIIFRVIRTSGKNVCVYSDPLNTGKPFKIGGEFRPMQLAEIAENKWDLYNPDKFGGPEPHFYIPIADNSIIPYGLLTISLKGREFSCIIAEYDKQTYHRLRKVTLVIGDNTTDLNPGDHILTPKKYSPMIVLDIVNEKHSATTATVKLVLF